MATFICKKHNLELFIVKLNKKRKQNSVQSGGLEKYINKCCIPNLRYTKYINTSCMHGMRK